MVPQNGAQQRNPQPHMGFPGFMTPGADAMTFNEPHVAKQMAALSAMNQARISQNSRPMPSPLQASGGTSSGSYLGAITSPSNFPSNSHDLLNGHANFPMSNNFGMSQTSASTPNASFLDPSMSRPPPSKDQQLRARELQFLQTWANFFAKNGSPLPPALTGLTFPHYDASASPWSVVDPGSEVGYFKIAGKDVSIFKLWATVLQAGGSAQVEGTKSWPSVVNALSLPAEATDPQTNTPVNVLKTLHDVYGLILAPFEAMYRRNVQEQQKKSQATHGQPVNSNMQTPTRPLGQNGMASASMAATNGQGSFSGTNNQQRPPLGTSESHGSLGSSDNDPFASSDNNLLDQDVQGIKRKHDGEGPDTKRVRQKTDPPEGNPSSTDVTNSSTSESRTTNATGTPNRPRLQPARRKIEYVPWGREMETYGGWDVDAFEAEVQAQQARRPIRDLTEWGLVDTEHLSMSLRSGLAVELSYALTTFTVLSTMREQVPGTGLGLVNCPELLEDILDLLEETAFDGPDIALAPSKAEASQIFTNKELLSFVQDTGTLPFASLDVHQGTKDPSLGPFPRPASVITAIIGIIRNLSCWTNNWDFLAASPRVADLLLRLCLVERSEDGTPRPVCRCLSINDLIFLRREIMIVFLSISGPIKIHNSTTSLRVARRLFELTASYLVHPAEAVPPLSSVQLAGVVPSANLRPPLLAENALEVFSRFAFSDNNRQHLANIIPHAWIQQLLTHLVHRLPMVDADFLLMQREYWSSFIEKVILSIYSLLFIAPYDLKQRIKADRRLSVKGVLLGMSRRILMLPNDGRSMYHIPARRAVEALKLLDKGEEKVDKVEPALPALQFGMGFSDGNDSSIEKGTGLLGASKDVAWEMLMTRDVFGDETFFNELDSLVRVESL